MRVDSLNGPLLVRFFSIPGNHITMEGFGWHRFVPAHGSTHPGGDSSFLEVHRRQRRAQSDAVDVRQLLTMLMRDHDGARHVWRGVTVSSVDAEEQRHRHRALATLTHERARTSTRLKGLLRSQGRRLARLADAA